MGLIFALSAQPAAQSQKTSGELAQGLVHTFRPGFSRLSAPQQAEILGQTDNILRKGAHAFAYFVLSLWGMLFLYTYSLKALLRGGIVLVFCLLYAVSDEVHQIFVDGRGPAVTDVLIDTAGAVCGILLTLLFALLYKKIRGRAAAPKGAH